MPGIGSQFSSSERARARALALALARAGAGARAGMAVALLMSLLAPVLTGCGSSSGSSPAAAFEPVRISGVVSFDRVPVTAGGGLDYTATQPVPARGVLVQMVGNGTVLAESATDEDGHYSLMLSQSREVRIQVRAEMHRAGSGGWHVRVVDNTAGNALYALDSAPIHGRDGDQVRNLHAASGWNGAAYSQSRAAAPFAILDVIHDAMALVREADEGITFPPLQVHWSPLNAPVLSDAGTLDVANGDIGSSFFAPGFGIYVLGAEGEDTDEFDRHVIAHEWGHFFEEVVARSDSQGGPHALGDHLDPRVAFSEGWANAFSAFVTGDSIYKDSLGPGQADSFTFDISGVTEPFSLHRGWFSEQSVQELLYALFEPESAATGRGPGFGFAQLHDVMAGPFATDVALTTIFSFLHALKTLRPEADAPAIDQLTQSQAIDPVVDAWASDETNAGYWFSNDVLPLYQDLVPGGGAVNVCSSNTFTSFFSGAVNKLSSRRFLRVEIPVGGLYTVTSRATLMPEFQAASPGIVVHRVGRIATTQARPGDVCSVGDPPSACAVSITGQLSAGTHVIEAFEWTNAQEDPDHPPIGRTCFDVQIAAGAAGKPVAPLEMDYTLEGTPVPGVPLTVHLRVRSGVALESLALSVHGDEELVVTTMQLPTVSGAAPGEVLRASVTVLPVAGRAHLTLLARAHAGGHARSAVLTVPVSAPALAPATVSAPATALVAPTPVDQTAAALPGGVRPAAQRRHARVTVDARGERLFSLPAEFR